MRPAKARKEKVSGFLVLHKPVMSDEALEHLELSPGNIALDCTVGCGGHAQAILNSVLPGGRLIGIDWDKDALEEARKSLVDYKGHFDLFCDNFANAAAVLDACKVKKIDACLVDLGMSSLQLENPGRGFSIKYDGPLDMRMDKKSRIDASQIVNDLPEYELMKLLRAYGEERFARSIARGIARARSKKPIATTWELAKVVTGSMPARFRHRKIHPATRTFQALRIAVNKELGNLEQILDVMPGYLKEGSRICVISFHSLEDRIVKRFFKKSAAEKTLKIITKKPLVPRDAETKENPRARSAKLRVAEKT